jgi:hypothetical protein
MSRRAWLAAVLAGVLSAPAAGCSRNQPDATPEGVARLWLERMEDSTDDPAANKEAFDILSARTKKNLEQRALRDGPRQGRRIAPQEMLAAGYFGLKFRPKHFKAQGPVAGSNGISNGDRIAVEVRGDDKSEFALITCVREPNKEREDKKLVWRVELDLPEPEPLEKRDKKTPP